MENFRPSPSQKSVRIHYVAPRERWLLWRNADLEASAEKAKKVCVEFAARQVALKTAAEERCAGLREEEKRFLGFLEELSRENSDTFPD